MAVHVDSLQVAFASGVRLSKIEMYSSDILMITFEVLENDRKPVSD